MPEDQRMAPRFSLIAVAEIIEMQNEAHLKARTSDVSVSGCYVDMMTPLPAGTKIKVRITYDNETFTATGTVVYSAANMGMGVQFNDVDVSQIEVLKKWVPA
jgi:hypothetical protein